MNDKTEQTLIKLQKKIDWIAIGILVALVGAAGYLMSSDRSVTVSADTGAAPAAKLEDTVANSPDYAAFQQLSKTPSLTDFPLYQSMIKNSIFDAKTQASRQNLRRSEEQKFEALKAQVQPLIDKIDKKENVDAAAKEAAIKAIAEFRKSAPANMAAMEMHNIIDPPPAPPADAPAAAPGAGGGAPGMPGAGMPGMPGAPGMPGPGGAPAAGGAPLL